MRPLPPARLRDFLPQLFLLLTVLSAGCDRNGSPPPNATPSPEHASDSTPPAPAAPAAAQTISLITYNVLGNPVHDDQRWPALFKLCADRQPDVLCLQEVAPIFLTALQAEPWFKDHYHLPAREGQSPITGDCLICTRAPIQAFQAVTFKSNLGRTGLLVKIQIHDRTLAIATGHLESMLEDGNLRAEQLDALFAALASADDAILAGDFNFGDGEQPETDHLNNQYTDLWRALHPKDPGLTWNIEKSPMAKAGSFPEEHSRRLDRILLRSSHSFYRPAKIEILGDQPIHPTAPTLFPSDHFGLYALIEPAPTP